ncbi:hypothetical protein C8Q76DRAFT_748968 [Earliella scabrosa]|nr:hypothetical protein C8Q76DRAFT_748968 [Earliella scabrosa]
MDAERAAKIGISRQTAHSCCCAVCTTAPGRQVSRVTVLGSTRLREIGPLSQARDETTTLRPTQPMSANRMVPTVSR